MSSARRRAAASSEATPPQAADSLRLWVEAWYPLAFEEFTDKSRPHTLDVLAAPVVFWWDSVGGAWRCGLDRCTHRLAKLSEGKVDVEGHIECPYHGWAFCGASGSCTRIPQLDAGGRVNEERARLLVMRTEVRQGLIWAWAAPLVGSDAPPDLAALERLLVPETELPGVTVLDYTRDLPMDATILCENVMDPSHLPFTHDGTISNRNVAGPVPLKLRGAVAREGFAAERSTSPPGEVEFRSPGCVVAETRRAGSYRDWNVVYAVPLCPGRVRAHVRVVFEVGAMVGPQRLAFGILFQLPRWMLHQNNHKILEDDNIFLHHQDLALRGAEGTEGGAHVQPGGWRRELYLASSADVMVAAYRTWLERFTGGRGPSWSMLAPASNLRSPSRMSRAELLDRGASHTSHCSCCSVARQNALAAVPVAEVGVVAGLAAAATGLGGMAGYGIGFALGAWAVRSGCQGLADATEQGSYPPPRNRRRSSEEA